LLVAPHFHTCNHYCTPPIAMTALVQPSSITGFTSASPYGYGSFGSYRSSSLVPLVTITTVTQNPPIRKKGLFRKKTAAPLAAPVTTVTPGPGAVTVPGAVAPNLAWGAPVSTTSSTGPISVQGPISAGLPAVSGISQAQFAPSFVQQPLAVQQTVQQPLVAQQALGAVQQAAQPVQPLGTTTFSQPLATQGAVGQPLYQAQAAPVQGFSQQQFQQESHRFESNIPSAREAGNWNQLGENGWYNQAGGQQFSAQPMAMQQATGQQLYQAEPIVQQQGFNQAASQQASFAAPSQQMASSTTGTNLAASQGSNIGGYSWYNEQAGQSASSTFAQPMMSSNLGQASSINQPASMQQASSFEQQAASSVNQSMGQATSELGRAATQSLEGSLSHGVQGGSQFLSSAAPVGTGAR